MYSPRCTRAGVISTVSVEAGRCTGLIIILYSATPATAITTSARSTPRTFFIGTSPVGTAGSYRVLSIPLEAGPGEALLQLAGEGFHIRLGQDGQVLPRHRKDLDGAVDDAAPPQVRLAQRPLGGRRRVGGAEEGQLPRVEARVVDARGRGVRFVDPE